MTQPMTQQQSFPPEQHDDLDSADYAEADRQRVREDHSASEQPEYKTWDRWEQLNFLQETTTKQFNDNLLEYIVASMTDKEFLETYEFLTRVNGLARDYQELNRMSQIPQ